MEYRKSIVAPDGWWYTNGYTYGTEVYPADGVNKDDYYLITNEEYEELFSDDVEKIATEQDYQNALREMGVSV